MGRCTESADLSMSDLSRRRAELASSADPCQRSLCRWQVSKTSTPALVVEHLPLVTSPRPRSRPSARHTSSSLQTCGRTTNSPFHHTRNSPTTWRRTTSKVESSEKKSRSTKHTSMLFAPLRFFEKKGKRKKKKKKKKKS